MKEIKAYIRPALAHSVVHKLIEAGAQDMTVIDTTAVGEFGDINTEYYLSEIVERCCKAVKLELVCLDNDAERFIEIIKCNARTGESGDGAIFVSGVERSIKIKTGEEGGIN